MPVLETFAAELQGYAAGTTVNVEVLLDAPQRDDAVWSAVYTFTTDARVASDVSVDDHPFVEQGVLLPENPQHIDHYGSAIALRRGVMAVGAVNRAASSRAPSLNAGAVFVDRLHLLDIGVEAAAYDVDEDAIALDIVSRRCSGECVPPTIGQGLFESLAPVVEGRNLVHFAGHSLRCYTPDDLDEPANRNPVTDSVDLSLIHI